MDDVPVKADTLKRHQFESQERFLKHYASVGNASQACELAGVARQTMYDWQTNDSQGFRDRWDQSRGAYADSLERLVHERLIDPSGNRGSDILLMFNLKSRRPEVYGDRVTVQDDTSRDMLSILRARPSSTVVVEGTGRELPAGNATDAKDQD